MRWGFVGDLVVDTTLRPERTRAAFDAILGTRDWSLAGNLELPLCRPEVGQRASKVVAWRGPEETAELLARSGITVVSLANNHATDWGIPGLLATVDAVGEAGVGCVGAGQDLAAASAAWASDSLAVCGLACTVPPGSAAEPGRPGMAALRVSTRVAVDTNRLEELPLTPPGLSGRYDLAQLGPLLDTIAEQAAAGRTVAALVHWGVAFTTRVDDYMLELAEALVGAGAGLVLGHHTHTLAPVARFGDALVCFGLGDAARSPALVAGADRERPGLAADWSDWSRVGLCVAWDEHTPPTRAEVIPFVVDRRSGEPGAVLDGAERSQLFSWLNWVSTTAMPDRPGWSPVLLEPSVPFPLQYAT